MIEMFFLVLMTVGYNPRVPVIVPEKYTSEQCVKAAKAWSDWSKDYLAACVPAPAPKDAERVCSTLGPGSNMVICK